MKNNKIGKVSMAIAAIYALAPDMFLGPVDDAAMLAVGFIVFLAFGLVSKIIRASCNEYESY